MPRELERLLVHPVTLLALALWALNDHYLKAAWGNGLTGKLSDVTSLIAGPVLLATLTALLARTARLPGLGASSVPWLLGFWSLTLGFVMVAINLWGPAATGYRYGLAALQWPFRSLLALAIQPLRPVTLTMDPGDLWTVPAALVPLWLGLRMQRPATQQASPEKRPRYDPSEPVNTY